MQGHPTDTASRLATIETTKLTQLLNNTNNNNYVTITIINITVCPKNLNDMLFSSWFPVIRDEVCHGHIQIYLS